MGEIFYFFLKKMKMKSIIVPSLGGASRDTVAGRYLTLVHWPLSPDQLFS